jgi:hypothetical protein
MLETDIRQKKTTLAIGMQALAGRCSVAGSGVRVVYGGGTAAAIQESMAVSGACSAGIGVVTWAEKRIPALAGILHTS